MKPKTRPGGRAARVVSAILDATMKEIARVGFAAFRVEDVAELAGVAKTTIYRRWPTKALLVVEAMRQLHGTVEPPDTGSLRSDLAALLGDYAKRLDGTAKRALARALLAAGPEPELRAAVAEMRRERLAVWDDIFQRAIARGELPKTVDRALLAEVVTSPFALRMLRGEAIDTKSIDALIGIALEGAIHGGGAIKRSRSR